MLWLLLAAVPSCAPSTAKSLPGPQVVPAPDQVAATATATATRAEAVAQRFASNRANRLLFDSAIVIADSALRLDSTLVPAHVARGIAFTAAGRPRDAAVAYRRALALDPDYPRAANSALGQFWRAGFYDEAHRWSRRQAEREPRNLAVLFNYAVASAFLIEPARAESLLVRALEVDPRFATAHGELAFLAQYSGRQLDAVRHMEAAVALDTTSSLNLGGLAQVLIPAGQAARARSLLEPVIAKDSTATAYGGRSVLAIYAWALKETGDTAQASRFFDRALARLRRRELAGETTYQLFREMAAVQALQGDRAGAIASLRKATDAGLHTFASWELSDPMFASIRREPEVEMLVERMRSDTRRLRARAGLP